MSGPNTFGLPCAFVTSTDPYTLCGEQYRTIVDPRQDRHDIGLCPAHVKQVDRGHDHPGLFCPDKARCSMLYGEAFESLRFIP